MRPGAALAIGLALAGLAPRASADQGDQGEPVALVTRAPSRCLTTEVLLRQIGALGGTLREAKDDEPARRIEVTIARETWGYDVLLALRNRDGQVRERRVKASDCAAAAKAASLLVVLALDEAPPAPPEAESAEVAAARAPAAERASAAAFWPAPVSDDGGTTGMTVRRVKVGRLGSGGLLLTGVVAINSDLQSVAGGRLVAVKRIVSTMRLGLGLSVDREHREVLRDGLVYRTSGWSGRASAAVAWGAPWDDFPVGFLGEVGVAGGEQNGTAYERTSFDPHGGVYCAADYLCEGRGHPTTATYVSPFLSWSLLFQVPFKSSPVRPVAGLTSSWTPFEPHGSVTTYGATLGAVWQAW